MIKFIKKYLTTNFKNKPFYQKPYFYMALGIIFISLSGIFYSYDIPYKNWVSENIAIRENNIIGLIFDIIRPIGKGTFTILLALLIGGIGLKKTCYKIFTAFVIMSIIVWSLKITVHRERPNKENNHSFPSGDAGNTTVLLISAASDIPAFAPLAIALVPSIAFLRTHDNYHHLSDVLAGIGFGIIPVGLAMFISFRYDKIVRRIKSRHLALLAVLMAIGLAIKKIPNFTDFVPLLMPSLFLWLLAPYLGIFSKRSKVKSKLFSPIRRIFQYFAIEKITPLMLRNMDYGLAVLSGIILFLTWIHCDNNFKLSISGLALIPINYLIIKEKMIANRKFKTASFLPFLSLLILVISALITAIKI
jgi:membrane-associated phospholipid phosphatase